jgi:hypothetical protein
VSSCGPARRLVAQVGDVDRPVVQVPAPFWVAGEGGGDGGQPGQRPGTRGLPGGVQAPVEDRGHVAGGAQLPAAGGGGEQVGGLVSVQGEQRQVRAQRRVGLGAGDPGDAGLGGGVDTGEPVRAEVVFGGDVRACR